MLTTATTPTIQLPVPELAWHSIACTLQETLCLRPLVAFWLLCHITGHSTLHKPLHRLDDLFCFAKINPYKLNLDLS